MIKYAEDSSDDEYLHSGSRRHPRDEVAYDDASDYDVLDDEAESGADDDDDDDESNLGLQSHSTEGRAEINNVDKKVRLGIIGHKKVATLRQDNHSIRRTRAKVSQAVDLNPDNLSRSCEMECKHGETLFRYHVRCLSTYKEIYGDMLVKQQYVVPWSKDWPDEMWGLRLGALVNSIRCGKVYQNHEKELTALGFVFSRQRQDIGWELTKLALETYKTIHDDLLVPYKFKIPDNSNDWPAATWGINLGSFVNNIRHSGTYFAHRDELIELGFQFRASR